MRRVKYVITPKDGHFGPGHEALLAAGVNYEAILDIDLLADGSIVFRASVDGDPSVVESALAEAWSAGSGFEVYERPGGTLLQAQFEPEGTLRELLELHREYGVLIEYPSEFVDPERSGLEITEVGSEADIRSLIEAKRDMVDVTITNVTTYEPAPDRLFGALTDRQREVLTAATELGYYDTPRAATYEDVAERVESSPSAVGQVLRRIEREVFTSIVPASRTADHDILGDR